MSADAMISVSAPATEADRAWLAELWRQEWGGEIMVTRGRLHRLADLQGLLAWEADLVRAGAATYRIEGDECELMSLNATIEGRGAGTALLRAVEEKARAAGCARVMLITSNDNLDGLRFYQRRGYRLVAVHAGAIDRARAVKPSIPLVGSYGIPLHDDLELEMRL